MTTGFLGTRPLLPVLSSVGQQTWRCSCCRAGIPVVGLRGRARRDHHLGAVEQLYQGQRIRPAERRDEFFLPLLVRRRLRMDVPHLGGHSDRRTGYRKVIIRPTTPSPSSNAGRKPIDWVKSSYKCVQGQIVSSWRVTEQQFDLDVTIPANTTATIYLPASTPREYAREVNPLANPQGCEVVRWRETESCWRSVLAAIDSLRRRIQVAKSSDKTSQPLDESANPDNIDLSGAAVVTAWKFSQDADIEKWPLRNNLQVARREGKTTSWRRVPTRRSPRRWKAGVRHTCPGTQGVTDEGDFGSVLLGRSRTEVSTPRTHRPLTERHQASPTVPILDRVGAADPDTAVRSVRERRRVADRVDHVVSLTTLVIGSSQFLLPPICEWSTRSRSRARREYGGDLDRQTCVRAGCRQLLLVLHESGTSQ